MTAKTACLACRVRKVRCIPATPRCLRCAELRIDECLYVSVKKRGTGNTLRMGEACQRCRQKKRRCDAKNPCTPCANLDGGSDCVYEQNAVTKRIRKKLPPAVQPFLFSFNSESSPQDSSSSWLDNENASLSTLDIASSDIGGSSFSSANTNSSRVSPESSHSPQSDGSDSPTSQERSTPETQLVSFREESPKHHKPQPTTTPIFSFPSYLKFPSIPRQLHIPLHFSGPERFQVSDTTSSELDLSVRLAALPRLRKLGIFLTGPKQNAIMCGDTSNTIVHPFFIPATAGLGVSFHASIGHPHTVIRLRAKHGQLGFQQIAEITAGSDASLKIHAFLYIAAASLYGRWFTMSREYLKKACIALNVAKHRFIPETGRPPKLTEDVHERLATLSQVIYFEHYFFFVVDGLEPIMTARIEEEFRNELRETYPCLFEICPLTMRTQGILLVKDVTLLVDRCLNGGVKPGQRKGTCDELVTRLEEYTNVLLRNIRRFIGIGDNHGAEIIQSSCVSCLAHLAVLCDLSSRLEPNSKPKMDATCDSSLVRLGSLTQQMDFDEYSYFDVLLRDSWKISLAAFNSRIDSLSREEGASLRLCRQIVAEAWSNINTGLPESSPSEISKLLTFADGREQGSSYPNFMSAPERTSYGL